MNEDQSTDEFPEREESQVDLEPIRKTYNAAIKVLKLGMRWLKTRPFAVVDPDSNANSLFYTYMDTCRSELVGYMTTYGYSGEMAGFISRTRPLFDALNYLDQTIQGITVVGTEGPLVTSPVFIDRLGVACEILGEVLDDLESEENPMLRPEWDREAKQLWYGETVCREYRKTAPEQFQILDLFQAREWPRAVPSPWRDEKKLRDTVGHLNDNHSQESLIRFEVFNMKPAWFRFRPRSESR